MDNIVILEKPFIETYLLGSVNDNKVLVRYAFDFFVVSMGASYMNKETGIWEQVESWKDFSPNYSFSNAEEAIECFCKFYKGITKD